MQFNPDLHTKDYLLNNTVDLGKLCMYSKDFALSELAQDFEILSCETKFGFSSIAALQLASISKEWGLTKAAQSLDVLNIRSNDGQSTAHRLAKNNNKWMNTDAAENYDVLKIEDNSGITVAHTFAQYQKEWMESKAANDINILSLGRDRFYKVAHYLAVHNQGWILTNAAKNYDVLMIVGMDGATVSRYLTSNRLILSQDHLLNKKILCVADQMEVSNAEYIVRESDSKIDYDEMIMILIKQGAAYKHSRCLDPAVGQSIFEQTNDLIESCAESKLKVKYLLALFSTCHYSHLKRLEVESPSKDFKNHNEIWLNLKKTSGEIIEKIFDAEPLLFDIEDFSDINCEPGVDFVHKIKAKKLFSEISATCEIVESSQKLTY